MPHSGNNSAVRSFVVVIAACALAGCGSESGPSYNAWFPLKPGTTLRYEGSDGADRVVDVFRITNRTKVITGVETTVVRDQLFKNGRLAEDTTDWYATDEDGNVRYYGEATKELGATGRVVSREGSWQAGVNGARAGIFMPAQPKVGQTFQQEHYRGHAEDHFKIVSIKGDTMTTHEWTPLEPGVLDEKRYRRAVGTSRERSLKGGEEFLKLVSVKSA